LSTFEAARAKFGVGGRQKSNISPSFCLFPGPRTPILDQPIDKKESFSPVFVYFWFRALKYDSGQSRDQQNYSKADCGSGQNAISCDLPKNAGSVD